MLKKFLDTLITEEKLLLRKIINIVPAVAIIVLAFIALYIESDPYYFFHSSSYLTQLMILWSLILGYNMQSQDYEIGISEVFKTIYRATTIKLIGRLVIGTLAVIFVSGACYSIGAVYLFKAGASVVYFREALINSITYWVLPSLVSMFLGLTIGIFIKSVLAYLLIIIISFVIGPISQSLHQLLGLSDLIDIRSLIMSINLGQYSNYVIDPLYGMEIETTRILTRVVILLLVAIIFQLSLLTKKYLDKVIGISLASVSIVILIFVLLQVPEKEFIYKNGHFENEAKSSYDYSNYGEAVNTFYSYDDFKMLESEIKIISNELLDVNIRSKLQCLKDVQEVKLTLYRDLKVSEVYINNAEAKFIQKDDFITVLYDFQENESYEITMEYKGVSSPNYYYSNKAALLLNYFPWTPRLGHHTVMYTDAGLFSKYISEDYPVKYKLILNDELGNIYTNLDKVSDNTFQGVSSQGVMMVYGMLQEKTIDEITFVYPISFNKLEGALEISVDSIRKIYDDIKVLDESLINSELKKIIVLPIPTVTSGDDGFFLLGDTLVMNMLQDYSRVVDSSILRGIIYGLLNNENIQAQDDVMRKLFFTSFINWYGSNKEIEIEQFPSQTMAEEEIKNLQDRLNSYVSSLEENEALSFYKKWLNLLKEDVNITASDIQELMDRGE